IQTLYLAGCTIRALHSDYQMNVCPRQGRLYVIMAVSRGLVVILLVGVAVVNAQYYDYTTPVPILKQINRHNDDGSYSYGYEGADGSYKIETKHPTGEVVGKYGYVDDTGTVREVEYGASRRGFEPAGTDINVAPPTLKTDNNYYRPNSVGEDYDDGQYHEDPSVYFKNPSYNSSPQKHYTNTNYNRPQQNYNPPQQNYNPPQQNYNPPQQNYNPPQQNYNPPQQSYNYNPQPSYNTNYNSYNPPQQSYHNQQNQQPYYPKIDPNQFRGHPATNFDVYSGSYSFMWKDFIRGYQPLAKPLFLEDRELQFRSVRLLEKLPSLRLH
ncbi:hypothetical protein L9F63_016119, partial [Diploptera punctata]